MQVKVEVEEEEYRNNNQSTVMSIVRNRIEHKIKRKDFIIKRSIHTFNIGSHFIMYICDIEFTSGK